MFSIIIDVLKDILHFHKWNYNSVYIKGGKYMYRECKCGKKQFRTKRPVGHMGNEMLDDNEWLNF